MKLIVIGLGQCGCRIADEFANLNKIARSQRGIDICPGVFAVNTDAADLSGLRHIKPDYRYRILIGGRKTLSGSAIGGIAETQELLDFCAQKGIVADCEMTTMPEINTAFERMEKGDVRYRFVVDMQTL